MMGSQGGKTMQTFTLSDLTRKTSDVQHAAAKAPVLLTEHKNPRFVLMAASDYEILTARAKDPRKVYRLASLDADLEGGDDR
jgi:PHD/YefM family antitoxin component YafN of YafNO toxin-antitoxin module